VIDGAIGPTQQHVRGKVQEEAVIQHARVFAECLVHSVRVGDAVRRETMGDLNTTTWQTFCYPDCGSRPKTVLVGNE
jgi:hypothetical protein